MGTITSSDLLNKHPLYKNTVHPSTSTMKFLISFVALAIVAVCVDAGFEDTAKFPEMTTINKIGDIQKSIGNINLAATDLNTMETNLEPLTKDENKATVT